MNTTIIVLAVISGLITLVTFASVIRNIYLDITNRRAAKARYEKDPNLSIESFEEFYVPSVTVGDVIIASVLWFTPGVNLVTTAWVLIVLGVEQLKRVWNNPVIDW
jgi:hypothetical protein